MNTEEFVGLLQDTWNTLEFLSATKGQEYAHSTDRLANFKRLADELEMEPEKVLWVYWTKHKDSLLSYINELSHEVRRVPSEPIEGRIDDAILYLILLKGLIRERGRLSEGSNAEVQLPRMDDCRPEPSGKFDTRSMAGDGGLNFVDRDKMVPNRVIVRRNPIRATAVLHEAAGGVVETGGSGDGKGGRGRAAGGDTC